MFFSFIHYSAEGKSSISVLSLIFKLSMNQRPQKTKVFMSETYSCQFNVMCIKDPIKLTVVNSESFNTL